mmetsp:Transcript_11284/g.18432  ORF Transcript_11284/g.18432 Transcript_11284/m.18432 type:complete len:376 (+) Transcript_11284:153-1280(+)|eukprot:CAMPEP_0203766866 /NCGR_PEP_ID=MMETSP0099_2-20121227/668_1 /ASSEMBLY_ACC=CAM_ASM_000209 /TAXON_ID=96639 /ORGANISM=" , Strain NY0313808BC1" /LENGTH=375 /DNA_ID=CAMNT_0050663289 /DNA_START=120 /DNA_END=1247 /DNA_ORIENTATION=+
MADSANGRNVSTPKKKSSPLVEFCLFYFGTLTTLYLLDKYQVLYPGKCAMEMFPHVDFVKMFKAVTQERLLFVFYGVLLIGPMHVWRTIVKACFSPIAIKFAGLAKGTGKHEKFTEQAWLGVHYVIVVAMEVYAVKYTTEMWPPMLSEKSRLIINSPFKEKMVEGQNATVQKVYLLQYTFYFLEFATLILDKRARARSDAFVYVIHHILTVILISMSFLHHCVNIGLLVLLFHDIGDVFLAIAKCFVYCEDYARVAYSKRTVKILSIMGVAFFIFFLVSFGFARLVLFPTLIYQLVYNGKWLSQSYNPPHAPEVYPEPISSHASPLVVLLLFLLPMHVYWFRLALRVAIRALAGVYDDERSDDEDSDEEPTKKDN